MKDLVIDEKYLKHVVKNVENLMEAMTCELDKLKDKNEDMFIRYMSYIRLHCILETNEFFLNLHKTSILAGHSLADPRMHTKKCKENGWDEFKTEYDSFFVNPDDETEEEEEEEKQAKDELIEKLFKVFIKAAKEQTNKD